MDLAQFDTTQLADNGSDLELTTPNGALILDEATKEPWSIHLLGVDSRRYQELQHKVANRRISRRARNRKALTTSEELDSDQLELLVEITTGWKHIVVDKKLLDYSKENARMLYTRFPWVREQAEDYVADRSNFLGESSKNSKSSRSTASN